MLRWPTWALYRGSDRLQDVRSIESITGVALLHGLEQLVLCLQGLACRADRHGLYIRREDFDERWPEVGLYVLSPT